MNWKILEEIKIINRNEIISIVPSKIIYQRYLLIIFFHSILKILLTNFSKTWPIHEKIFPKLGAKFLLLSSDHRIPLISILRNPREFIPRVIPSDFPRVIFARVLLLLLRDTHEGNSRRAIQAGDILDGLSQANDIRTSGVVERWPAGGRGVGGGLGAVNSAMCHSRHSLRLLCCSEAPAPATPLSRQSDLSYPLCSPL